VDRHEAEAERHELDDGAQADHRGADAHAGEPLLGDRRVDDPPLAEPLEHALADLVGPVVLPDLLPHQEDAVVALHLLGHRLVQGFAKGKNGHGHSCGMCGATVTSWYSVSREGCGLSSANSMLSSISRFTSSANRSNVASSSQPRSLS